MKSIAADFSSFGCFLELELFASEKSPNGLLFFGFEYQEFYCPFVVIVLIRTVASEWSPQQQDCCYFL